MTVELDLSALEAGFHAETTSKLKDAKLELHKLREKTCRGAEYTAWFDWPAQKGFDTLKMIRGQLAEISVPYDLVLVVGIGGSYAGAKAVEDALRHGFREWIPDAGNLVPIVFAGQNISETSLVEMLELLETREPIVNVISKSGTTLEANIAFRVIEQSLWKRYGKEAKERILVTTQIEGSFLHELATKRGYRSFDLSPNIGGRYSVLTTVGLVPLMLAGYDGEELLSGADLLFSELRNEVSDTHPVLQLASARKTAWDKGTAIDVLSYNDPKLTSFVEWWKQLFGESEGKEGKGLFPAGMLYSTDLHSLGQYMQEGPANVMETFLFTREMGRLGHIEKRIKIPGDGLGRENDRFGFLQGRYVEEVNTAAMMASIKAHSARGLPCLSLSVPRFDEFYLGYLFAFFETCCAISGALLGVNPFDQPGVEVYKKELYKMLQ